MRPLPLAFGKLGEVGDSLGRIVFEQAACNVSFAGFKGGIESGLASHRNPFENVISCRKYLDGDAVSMLSGTFWLFRVSRRARGGVRGLFHTPSGLGSGTATDDADMNDLHGAERLVIAGVASHAGDLLHQRYCGFIALPKDSVITAQMRQGHFRDEEL